MVSSMPSNQPNSNEGSTLVDGLPKSFVDSMRTLFDIMDDQRTGFIKFTEIERRWHEDGTQGLPQGVLNSIRKLTPPDGYLSFDRFCAGLKMSLLRSKPRDDTLPYTIEHATRSSGTISPANSLDTVPPLVCSSPQSSPQSRNRPLSAPLLDQEIYIKKPLTNGNYINSMNKPLDSLQVHPHYINTHIYQQRPHHGPTMPQKQSSIDSKVYSVKPDIRMGIGGIKAHVKGPPLQSMGQNSQKGPPKPPRAVEFDKGTHSLDRNLDTHRHATIEKSNSSNKMSHSLERESRSDRRSSREKDDQTEVTIRRERGGSLERLLDGGNSYNYNNAMPANRTGVRSAIQTWFKEKSKSDLHDINTKNFLKNHSKKRLVDNPSKDHRHTSGYSLAIEAPTTRGSADGSNAYRNTISRTTYSNTIVSLQQPQPPPPPPQHTTTSNFNSHNPPHTYSKNNLSEGLYGRSKKSSTATLTAYKVPIETRPPSVGVTAHGMYVAPQTSQVALHKKTTKKESRRHTLQNGVDHNEMRRLRQLEAERDMLYQGLDVVERARLWYKQQLHTIAEKIHYLPLSPTKEPNMETQREKLNFQLARIHEINAHLRALMEASEKGLPTHINLAIWGGADVVNVSSPEKGVDNSTKRIKNQNKLLTEEVSAKSERITALEREKAALLREVFQARAATHPPADDTTFM